MARTDLSTLLGKASQEPPTPPVTPQEPAASQSPKRHSKATQAATEPRLAPKQIVAPKTATAPEVAEPRYLAFERKETRLRADQIETLTRHARALNKAKGTAGERITENTLIRVAVDLLLSKTGELEGRSEAELLHSVDPSVSNTA